MEQSDSASVRSALRFVSRYGALQFSKRSYRNGKVRVEGAAKIRAHPSQNEVLSLSLSLSSYFLISRENYYMNERKKTEYANP